MPNLNQVNVMGNITRDIELKYVPSGAALAKFSIAINNKYKDKSDTWQEKTTFVPIVVWGKQAENCGKYLSKGDPIFISGRIEVSSWDGDDGKKRYKTEVVASYIQYLKGKGQSSGAQTDKPAQETSSGKTEEKKEETPKTESKEKEKEDEVPF